MTAAPAAVRVRGPREIYHPARYRQVAALNGLDLDIGAGEIVALLGPSGGGQDHRGADPDRLLAPGHG
jgi:ABC-type nitrate/sulfonate/bicarbonate transport system ATPase subunit